MAGFISNRRTLDRVTPFLNHIMQGRVLLQLLDSRERVVSRSLELKCISIKYYTIANILRCLVLSCLKYYHTRSLRILETVLEIIIYIYCNVFISNLNNYVQIAIQNC